MVFILRIVPICERSLIRLKHIYCIEQRKQAPVLHSVTITNNCKELWC